jgi:hypothetical protein
MKGKTIPAGALGLDFATDGKLTFRILAETGPKSLTGRYSLNSGDYITLYLDESLSGRKTHREKIVIRGDTLQMIDSDGTTVAFDRVKK